MVTVAVEDEKSRRSFKRKSLSQLLDDPQTHRMLGDVQDSSIGMQCSTAGQYPGLPLIVMGRDTGGPTIGTSIINYRGSNPLLSLADVPATGSS